MPILPTDPKLTSRHPNIFVCTLKQSLAVGGNETYVKLSSVSTLEGVPVPLDSLDFKFNGRGVLSVDVQSVQRAEFISFTGVDVPNKKLTGIIRGLSWQDDSVIATNKKFHAVGAPVIIAFGTHNLRDIQKLVANASPTNTGVVRLLSSPDKVLGNPTISIGVPAIVTLNTHGLIAGDQVVFSTTGALPTGIIAGDVYYVSATNLTANTFKFGTRLDDGLYLITTTGTQSGVHTLTRVTPYAVGGNNLGKIMVDASDATPDYLNNKLTLGSSDSSATITPSILNPGGNEVKHFDIKVPAVGGGDGKVLVDGSDTTKDYLDNKIEVLSSDNSVIVTKSISNSPGNEKINYDLTHAVGGSILLQQTFAFTDFVPDTFGNMVAYFTGSMPVGAGPVGVKYDITAGFDAGSTIKVLDDDPAGQVVGTAVPSDVIAVLFGQTAGSAIFDWSVTPNPAVIIPGFITLGSGSVIVTIIGSGSSGQSAIQFEDEVGTNLGTAGTVTEFEMTEPAGVTPGGLINGTRIANKVYYKPTGKELASATDTTPGYLQPKLNIHSSDLTVTVTPSITNPGGNEVYDIDLTNAGGGTGGGGTGTPITVQDEFYGLVEIVSLNPTLNPHVIGELEWTADDSNSSTFPVTAIDGETGHSGIIKLTGASNTSNTYMSLGAENKNPISNIMEDGSIYRFIIRPEIIDTGGKEVIIIDGSSGNQDISLIFTESTGDVTFVTNDGVDESSTLGAYTSTNWYEVIFKVVGASVECWLGVNGATPVLVATHSTHIPTTQTGGIKFLLTKSSTLDIDYFSMYDPTANAMINQGSLATFKNGVATRTGSTATGTQTIAHGLGVIPKKVKISCLAPYNAGDASSFGIFTTAGSLTNSIYSSTDASGTDNQKGTSTTHIAKLYALGNAGESQLATISVDITNITLSWTKDGATGSGDIQILWETEA